MRQVVVDVQVLQTPALKRGMGQYVIAIVNALAQIPDTEVTLLMSSMINTVFTKEAKDRLKGFKIVDLSLHSLQQTKKTKRAIAHNKRVLNEWVHKENLDHADFLLGSLFQAEIYPAFPDVASRSAIMYDVIPVQFFHQYAPKMRWGDYLDRFTLLQEATTLFCISKTTANDLQVYASVESNKIIVINGGPGDLVDPCEPTDKPTKPFVLMPTGNDIRKNNRLAVEAFTYTNSQFDNKYQLVITSVFTEEERQRLSSISPDLFFTGVVSDEELAWYFAHCEAMLFLSLYEGLGMPLIEAMVFGRPIVASEIDVFTEISDKVAYYCNPYNRVDISEALYFALKNGLTEEQKRTASQVIKEFSWENSSNAIINRLTSQNPAETIEKRKRMAVLGPHFTGSSAIGKFMSELHPVLSRFYEVDYYYEKSPVDKVLRPDIVGHIATCKPIHTLTDSALRKYDEVLYHIGNSNHHTVTAARALRFPGIVILHDLNVENIYRDLLERKLIGQDRFDAEKKLDELFPSNTHLLQSLIAKQKGIVAHSRYAQDEVTRLTNSPVAHAELAVSTPLFDMRGDHKSFTIGLAGILAGIKGLETIERLAQREEFAQDKIKLFGLNFAEPGLLDQLRQLPNVEITTDLSDFEFQQNLKSLDVLVNFRVKYQGEASYATLEAMRYGIPVIVRGDFGWYSELPDDAVIKVEKEQDIADAVRQLKNDRSMRGRITRQARKTTQQHYTSKQYVDVLRQLIEGN